MNLEIQPFVPNELGMKDGLALIRYCSQLEVSPSVGPAAYPIPLNFDLRNVRFCTQAGVLCLATITSRMVAAGFTISFDLPKSETRVRGMLAEFGLDSMLSRARSAGAVTFRFDSPRSNMTPYSQRVFRGRPIFQHSQVEHFNNPTIFNRWIAALPPDIAKTEFFKHGRFARVIATELAANILDHASLPPTQRDGWESFGAIGMRIVRLSQSSSSKWLLQTYGEHQKDFLQKYGKSGFVEVSVCDPGEGIVASLQDTYDRAYESRNGIHPPTTHPSDVIQYMFDEMASSRQEEWETEAHAMSRLLRLVEAHGGIVHTISSGVSLTYRLDRHRLAVRDSGLGYGGDVEEVDCPWGAFFQLLVPLARPKSPPRKRPQASMRPDADSEGVRTSIPPIVISVKSQFSSHDLRSPAEFKNKTAQTLGRVRSALESIEGCVGLIDFQGTTDWRADHMVTLLEGLGAILREHRIVLLNVDPDLLEEIEDRHFTSVAQGGDCQVPPLGGRERLLLANLSRSRTLVLAVDTRSHIHWLCSPSKAVSVALDQLFLYPGRLSGVLANTRKFERQGVSCPTETELEEILYANPQLFGVSSAPGVPAGWRVLWDDRSLHDLKECSLTEHLRRHLTSPSLSTQAKRGHGKNQAFLLPHHRKYVSTFYECSRLLQEEEFRRDSCRALAMQVLDLLNGHAPDLFIASTAASLMIADTMREELMLLVEDAPPRVIDIGHFFDERRSSMLRGLDLGDRCVIVQDVIDTGATVRKIIGSLPKDMKVHTASLLRFVPDQEKDIAPGSTEREREGDMPPCTSLFHVPEPAPVEGDALSTIEKTNRFWIEPYSLHPFQISSLELAKDQYLPRDRQITCVEHRSLVDRLDKASAFRVGHFVYEEHHFSEITRLRHLFESSNDPNIADDISKDIVSCPSGTQVPATRILLVSLHSHIKYLLPTIRDAAVAEGNGYKHVYYTTKVRELGPEPYYQSPSQLEAFLTDAYQRMWRGEILRPVQLCILDDTASSGRAIDTILRSVSLADERAQKEAKRNLKSDGLELPAVPSRDRHEKQSPKHVISGICLYTVVNRMGRARTTLYDSITRWYNLPMSIHAFIELDAPTFTPDACPMCRDLKHVQAVKRRLEDISNQPLKDWIQEREKSLKPVIVDTKEFDDLPDLVFPEPSRCCVGDICGHSAHALTIAFREKAERGCPTPLLIEVLANCRKVWTGYEEDRAVQTFVEHAWNWFLTNWHRVASDAADESLRSMFREELVTPTALTPLLLHLLGMATIRGDIPEPAARKMVGGLFASLRNHIQRKDSADFKELQKISDLKELPKTSYFKELENRSYIVTGAMLLLGSLAVDDSDIARNMLNLYIKCCNGLSDRAGASGDLTGSIAQSLQLATHLATHEDLSEARALQIVTMEVLHAGRSGGKGHKNRLVNHLPFLALEYRDATRDHQFWINLTGSTDFFEFHGTLLCSAMSRVFRNYTAANPDLDNAIKGCMSKIRGIARRLRDVRDASSDGDRQQAWADVQEKAARLEELMFSKDSSLVYQAVKTHSVPVYPTCAEIFKTVHPRTENRCLVEKPATPDSKEYRATVLVSGKNELRDFIKNSTVDVVDHASSDRYCAVKIVVKTDSVLVAIQTAGMDLDEAEISLKNSSTLRNYRTVMGLYGASPVVERTPHPFKVFEGVETDPPINEVIQVSAEFLRGHA